MFRLALSALALAASVVTGVAAPAAAAVPEPPGNLRATAQQPESLTVAWNAVPGAISYSFTLIGLEGICAPNFRRGSTPAQTTTFGGLTWDCPYKVTVRAYVPSSWPDTYSDAAVLVTSTTLPDGYVLPAPPGNPRIDGTTLRWDAATGFGPLLYQVHADVPSIPEFTGPFGPRGGATSLDISDLEVLEPGQTATLWVTTIDRAWNESARSVPIVFGSP
jgi:hypothetical protein